MLLLFQWASSLNPVPVTQIEMKVEPQIFVVRSKEEVKDQEDENNESMMLKVLKFLIQIRFLAVELSKNKISFKMFSFNTLVHILMYIGPMYAILFVRLFFLLTNGSNDIIDKISGILFVASLYLCVPFSPLIVAKIIPSVPTITLASDLKFPNMWPIFVISTFLCIIGGILIEVNMFRSEEEWRMLTYISSLANCFITLCWMIPLLIVSAWMEKFIKSCKSNHMEKHANHSKECVKNFSDFQDRVKTYFLFVYRLSQFFVIFALFLAYTPIRVTDEFSVTDRLSTTIIIALLYSTGMVLVSISLVLNVLCLTRTLENLNKAMKDLAAPLREELVHEQGWSGRQRIRNILNDIESIRPITEHSIDRKGSILTAMLSLVAIHVEKLLKLQAELQKHGN